MQGIIEKVKLDYPKATHYCYAARAGVFERCSDDGEPSRSVGLPLLTLLQNKGVLHGILIIVRYFGGTKLGLGRLSRTYKDCGAEVLNLAEYCVLEEGKEYLLESSYSDYESLKRLSKDLDVEIEVTAFEEKVTLLLRSSDKIISSLRESLPGLEVKANKDIVIKRRIDL